jgi:hypothetical protein
MQEGLELGVGNDAETGRLPDGSPLVATINTTALGWDQQASHPWIVRVILTYDGKAELKDHDGYLNIGRQTGGGKREIYLACWDFRKPLKMMAELVKRNTGGFHIGVAVNRDKYWRWFEKFKVGKWEMGSS